MLNSFSYDAFGRPEGLGDSSLDGLARHAGRPYDAETGLYYNRARYYDPAAGCFISEDPIGFAAGDTNLYRYVGNSPLNATDPSGNIIETPWDGLSVAVGIGSIAYDVYNIATTGEGWGDLGMDTLGLGVDVGAAFLPGVPGGVSFANRAARAGHQAVSVGRKIDTGLNAYQAGRAGIASYQSFQQGDVWGGTLNLVGAGLGGAHFGIRGASGAKRFAQNYEIDLSALGNRSTLSMAGLGELSDVIKKKSVKPKHAPDVERWKRKGGTVTEDADGVWTYTDWDGNTVTYVNGYPNFEAAGLVRQKVDIEVKGNYTTDFTLADAEAPLGPKLDTSTWHHHENVTTMQEVDRKVHRRFTHKGGVSLYKGG